ncbi:MAG: hypothetical protein JOZ15_15325 [Acidobacteria bacterium]|nr:hypothetical protein [Acidobacteriota bacterium]
MTGAASGAGSPGAVSTHADWPRAVPAAAGPPGAVPVGASVVSAAGSFGREPEMQTQPIPGPQRAGAMAPGSAAPSLFPAAAAAGMTAPPMAAAPASGADVESERRIQQLLDEGQAALDGGDPQAAIDAWSRIFLIDIDHQEAARRIEKARRMKAERDRQVEETFHDGLARLEANDAAGARAAFQRVLELQPGHLQSREYLQQLDEGSMPAVTGAGRAGSRAHAAMAPAAADSLSGQGPSGDRAATSGGNIPPLPAGLARAAGAGAVDLADDHDLQEEILVPPDVSQGGARPAEARREVRSASAAHAGRARRLFLLVGGPVLLLVLTVGWFLYQKREQWFPNSRTEEPAQPAAPNPIPRAIKLHNSGRVAMALALLSRLPPGDPNYKEAQSWIAKWQAEPAAPDAGAGGAPGAAGQAGAAPGAPGAGAAAGTAGLGAAGPGGAPAGAAPDPDRRRSLIEEAGQAYQEGAYLRAAERYEAADRLGKLDGGDAAQFNAAKQKLVPLQRQIAMFRSHDWEFALPELWRIHESEPGNRDVTRMIVDSYYNLGVRDLLHNEVAKAAQQFGEAKTLAPDDPEIKRQLVFAQTYLERNPDLLYRIYVKYLPIR